MTRPDNKGIPDFQQKISCSAGKPFFCPVTKFLSPAKFTKKLAKRQEKAGRHVTENRPKGKKKQDIMEKKPAKRQEKARYYGEKRRTKGKKKARYNVTKSRP